ncbi:MAG: hypothetical protein KDE53_03840 [Caldilineaceae bacterium]|nr:hypothetical protein [Caldilineaceae bacterium]
MALSWPLLPIVISALLLFAGWMPLLAFHGSHVPQAAPALLGTATDSSSAISLASAAPTDGVTITYFLPLIAQNSALPVTAVTPQAVWSADWWQWAERLSNAPIVAEGNVDCGLGQSGDLWFLAGTTGEQPVVRTCTVPADTIFLVPIHTVAWGNEGSETLSVPEKRAALDGVYSAQEPGLLNSKLCRLESSVDGHAFSNMRLQSPTFPHKGDPEGVADGFWFAFRASEGSHEVRFRGTLCDFNSNAPINDVDVTYQLTVEAPNRDPGAVWQLFVWNLNVVPQATGCDPVDPDGAIACASVKLGRNAAFAAAPPWSYVAPATGATLTVVDIAAGGDQFEIFDQETSIGMTSPSVIESRCEVPEGGDPGVCVGQEGMSYGIFDLAPGSHSITIMPRNSAAFGSGYFRFEPKVAP